MSAAAGTAIVAAEQSEGQMSDDAPLTMETPWRRDTAELGERLLGWARTAVADDVELGDVTAPEGNGMSSETVLFSLRSPGGTERRLVARLAPADDVFPVFERYDLELQARCMRLVGEQTEVPVPVVPYYEPDPSWLGSPFLVMERVDGVTPPDLPPYVFSGWVVELDEAQREEMVVNAIRVLAQLHEITPTTHDLSFLGSSARDGELIDQLLAAQRRYYDWARGEISSALIEATFDWLEANRPEHVEPVLNWGDSRIGNMLWQGPRPVAVLDWEMAAIGPREVDLAWMVFLHAFFQGIAERFEIGGLPDFMTRDQAVRHYQELSGHTVSRLDWFEVFAALRFAIVSVRTSSRSVHYGQTAPFDDPDELIMFKPMLEAMLAGTYWD